ncbi:MAG: tetratricopeptide repeat protein [Candidatus Latescibacterota bacterium]
MIGALLVGVLLGACLPGPGQAGDQDRRPYDVWSRERIQRLRERVTRAPQDARLRVVLASAYFADGNAGAARRELQEALRLQPQFPEAHCNLATVLHALGELASARAHYEAALEADSSMVEAMAGLGTLLCRTPERARGLAVLERAVALDARRHPARLSLALAYHRAGDFPRAIGHLQTLMAQEEDYPGAQQALANAWYRLGIERLRGHQPVLALRALERAAQWDPGRADLHAARGLAHLDAGDERAAEAAFRQALAIDPEHVPALHNLGVVCESLSGLPSWRRAAAPAVGCVVLPLQISPRSAVGRTPCPRPGSRALWPTEGFPDSL